MKLRPGYLMLVGFLFLTTILFLRTTGLHIDEWSYLSLSNYSWKEASQGSGKSALFYWMNYKLHQEIARSFGPLKPVTIYLFYIAAFATSLVWAIRPFFHDRRKHLAIVYGVLLLSPLVLLNTTQVMMETAILPLVSLAFGSVLRGGDTNWKLARLFLLSALMVALKITAMPVVLLLSALALRNSKKAPLALVIGAAAGQLGSQAVLRWIVQVQHVENYGGLSQLLGPSVVWQRLTGAAPDLYVWMFFVGLAAITGVLVWAYNRLRKTAEERPGQRPISDGMLLMLAAGSLAFLLFVQSISIFGFSRYNYPALWLGLMASVLLVARHRMVALLPLAAVFALQSFPLIGNSVSRFDLWPTRTTVEFINSGGTILMSTPVHRLAVRQLLRDPAPCYDVSQSIHKQERGFYLNYFDFAFPNGKPADAAQSCASTIRVWRDPAEKTEDSCPARCSQSALWSGCGYQRLLFYTTYTGLVLNQVCW